MTMPTTRTSNAGRCRRYDPAMSPPGQGRDGARPLRSIHRTGFGGKIQRERLRRGLTQQAAADLVGADISSFQRWESGESDPRGLYRKAVERFLRGE